MPARRGRGAEAEAGSAPPSQAAAPPANLLFRVMPPFQRTDLHTSESIKRAEVLFLVALLLQA